VSAFASRYGENHGEVPILEFGSRPSPAQLAHIIRTLSGRLGQRNTPSVEKIGIVPVPFLELLGRRGRFFPGLLKGFGDSAGAVETDHCGERCLHAKVRAGL
jgi:hypothetical protein